MTKKRIVCPRCFQDVTDFGYSAIGCFNCGYTFDRSNKWNINQLLEGKIEMHLLFNLIKKIGLRGFGVLSLLLIVLLGPWYTVNQGERAVLLRFGKMVEVTGPGFHFKLPIIDGVEKISVRTLKWTHKISVYSKDIQSAEVQFSLNYSINSAKVGDIYEQYGMAYGDRVILPQIMAKPKDIFGKYNAVSIVQNREKISAEILAEFTKQFEATGIIAESVQIENIDFSDAYEKSVEERMMAEVEVQKVTQNLQREEINANMVRVKAKAAADARVMEANADATAIKVRGEAEASAIEAKAKALDKNPSLVELIKAERWNGTLPTTMLPNGTVPIISTK